MVEPRVKAKSRIINILTIRQYNIYLYLRGYFKKISLA